MDVLDTVSVSYNFSSFLSLVFCFATEVKAADLASETRRLCLSQHGDFFLLLVIYIMSTPTSNHQIHVIFQSFFLRVIAAVNVAHLSVMKTSFYNSASCVIPERGLSMFTAQLSLLRFSYLLQLYTLSPSLYHTNTITQPHVFFFLSVITGISALFTGNFK